MPNLVSSLVGGVSLLSATVAFAGSGDFIGQFSGFYAPADWVTAVSGNATYDATAVVSTAGAPNNVTIIGATSQNTGPTTPYSVVTYSTTIQGSSPGAAEAVSFSYIFFNPANIPNAAEVLDNGVVVGNLSSSSSYFSMPTGFVAGSTLTIQVTSANEQIADVLEITPVPEPSTIALSGVGGLMLLWQARRKLRRN